MSETQPVPTPEPHSRPAERPALEKAADPAPAFLKRPGIIDLLRARLRKLKQDDPNIYPHW